MGPLSSQQIPRVHCYLLPKIFWLLSTRLSLSLVHFPKWFDLPWYFLLGWAVFFSLAATWKIEFSFFSSCYLDVSVRRVLLHKVMYSLYDDCVFHSRVSPFGVLGVMAFCELALVFVHLRPSSSSCAKASTWRPFFLDWKYCLLFNFLLNFLGLRPATISWSHDGETYIVLHQPDRLA